MPTTTRPLTDAQWIRLQPYLHAVPAYTWAMPSAAIFLGRRGAGSPVRAPLGASGRPSRGLWARRMPSMQDGPGAVRRAAGQHSRARARECPPPPNKESDPALGRSRGGFSLKVHRLSDRRGRRACA